MNNFIIVSFEIIYLIIQNYSVHFENHDLHESGAYVAFFKSRGDLIHYIRLFLKTNFSFQFSEMIANSFITITN